MGDLAPYQSPWSKVFADSPSCMVRALHRSLPLFIQTTNMGVMQWVACVAGSLYCGYLAIGEWKLMVLMFFSDSYKLYLASVHLQRCLPLIPGSTCVLSATHAMQDGGFLHGVTVVIPGCGKGSVSTQGCL